MKKLICSLFLLFFLIYGYAQIDDNTRAHFIIDVAKSVNWTDPEFEGVADFKIGVLAMDNTFFMELANVVNVRNNLHKKKIKLMHFRKVENIEATHVLFVYQPENYNIKKINKGLKENQTLLITENFEFQKSMINFIVVDGKPQFEANEEMIKEAGLKVSQLFLAHSIKTREDWEKLYEKTDVALDEEKEITAKQKVVIEDQKAEIAKLAEEIKQQKAVLEKLNAEIEQKQRNLEQKTQILYLKQKELAEKIDELKNKNKEIKAKKQVLADKQQEISKKTNEIAQQDKKLAQQNLLIGEQLAQIEKQRLVLYFLIIVVLLFVAMAVFIYRAYKIKKEANIALEKKNKIISEQKDEIEKERDVIKSQRDQIAYQKKHITDSIEYAQRIQHAIIPSIEFFSDKIDHFVLFKPRDIVSGDFYWNYVNDDYLFIVAADCTGHGVPGAFMSMLGVSLLNEIVINKEITEPNDILNRLRQDIILSLKQKQDETSSVKDGMDITICKVDLKKDKLYFSGANNPLFLYRKGELMEVKGDKMPVAIYRKMEDFQQHEIELQKGDTFYIFSDGFVDQFGGPSYKKFLTKNFKLLLGELQNMSMPEQGKKLDEVFEDWKKEVDQLDDVCVIGVRY